MNIPIQTIPCVGIAMMCMACFLPPVHLYMDTLYLPKHYLFLCGLSVCLMSFPLAALRCGVMVVLDRCLRFFMFVFPLVAAFECLYVFFDIMLNGINEAGASGSFDNPSGLALSLCVALPVLAMSGVKWHGMGWRWLCALWCAALVFVVLLTKSRTGLICVVMCVLAYVVRVERLVVKSAALRKIVCGGTVAILLTSVILFASSRKTDSTSGRCFILQQTCRLVKERPLAGWGTGGFEREYMLRQADFFRHNKQSEYAMLADDVQHPLNEYMFLWVEYGIAGPLALLFYVVFVVWRCHRHDSVRGTGLPLSLLAVAVFCMFSYPSHYQTSWLVVVMSVAAMLVILPARWTGGRMCALKKISGMAVFIGGVATLTYVSIDSFHELRWRRAYVASVHGKHDEALEMYENTCGYFKDDGPFLYSYALAAFMADDMDRALEKIEMCGRCWNGYDRELLAGDICLNKCLYEDALRHYSMAADMCPVRFAPLEGMYRAYDKQNQVQRRDSVAKVIAEKQVKVNSPDVERIKNLCGE